MTISVMCVVEDMVAGQFGRPFFAINTASAIRSFRSEVCNREAETLISQYPADFRLFLAGFYEDETGKVDPVPELKLLVTGVQCLNADGLSEAKSAGNVVDSPPRTRTGVQAIMDSH